MTFYGEKDDAGRSVLQIAMPRLPRLYAPGGTNEGVKSALDSCLGSRNITF